jgi:hypothetical protein
MRAFESFQIELLSQNILKAEAQSSIESQSPQKIQFKFNQPQIIQN